MKQTVDFYQFEQAFRSLRPDNFSYYGLKALFDYFEEYEDETSTEIELDVIAICCDYCEYENLKEFQENYGDEYESYEDIERETQIIAIDDEDEINEGTGSFIIQSF